MKFAAAIVGAAFVFIVILLALTFIANNLVENLPTRYQLLGYGFCLLTASAGAWESFKTTMKRGRVVKADQTEQTTPR
jgi:hypothetical protein